MDYPFTDNYDFDFLLGAMMGPNAMRMTEELCAELPLRAGMRVLDLGCGRGISSLLLAEKYGLTVFAADLWISPSENYRRFERLGLAERIFPLQVDVTGGLPFAQEYFDLILSVDAYHYFGCNQTMLPSLLPFLKSGGQIGVAVPGLQREFPDGVWPEKLKPFWAPDMNFYTAGWWRELWSREAGVEITSCREMDCCARAWADWLQSPNPYAQGDIAMLEAEGGEYFNLVQITARKI